MTGWRECKLGDVLELKRGYDLPSQQREVGVVPVVSSSGPSGYHSRAMVKAPGVVTGRYGTLGQVFLVTEDFWPLNTTLYVRDFKGSDPKFVSYFLRSIDFYSCSDKAAVPGVNRNHLHELPVRVPPFREQRAIAHVLGALDDKVELNRKMNETLEAMARALFKSWFDQQLARGDLEESMVSDLAAAGVLQVGDGYRAKNDEMADDGLPFARAGNIDNGFDFTGADLLGEPGVSRAADKIARAYDVVFTSKGTVGRFAFVDPAMPPFVYSPQLCFWRSTNTEALNPFVLRQWMASRWFMDQVDRVKGQTDMAEYVSLRDQRAMRFPLAAPKAQSIVGAQLATIQKRVWANERESSTLRTLRDELLPRLLSGEISVAETTTGAGHPPRAL